MRNLGRVSIDTDGEGRTFKVGNKLKETHLGTVVLKASKRLYLLEQLQCAGFDEKHLIDFYNACIRSVVEYA